MTQWQSPFGARSTADEVVADLDLSGRSAVVTGANVGIGFETARALAARGADVVLACRDESRGTQAADGIRERHPDARVEVRVLDLASLESVRRFAAELPGESLDMLVCNAGLFGGGYRETEEGFEATVGVCHIGHFLLTLLLIDRLEAAGGRVVMVSSTSHKSPRQLDFSRLPQKREGYSDMVAYGQAKLCNVLFAKELQRRFGERGITAFALHPGTLVATEIGRHSAFAKILIQIVRPFTKSLGQGAATSVLCAAHPAVAELGGEYFSDCALERASREACDPEVAKRLWELSEAWTGLRA
jgi:WW domain-containing oxidoreductase